MVQIINRGPSIGGSIGQSLGESLGAGLSALAEHKVNSLLQEKKLKQTKSGLEALGFNSAQAENLTRLSPDIQKSIIERKLAAPGEQAYLQSLQSILGGGYQQPMPQDIQQSGQQLTQPQAIEENSPFGIPSGINAKQATELFKLNQEERKIASKEQLEARKDFQPKWDKIKQRAESAAEDIRDYEIIKKLAGTKNIRSGASHQLLEKLGLEELGANTETQLLDKTVSRLAQHAADAFNTGRLTNLDVNLYKKSLGSLKNTPEALKAIAEVNILTKRADEIRREAVEEAKKRAGGKITWDTLDEADAIAKPKLKELSNQVMQTIESTVNKQSGAGTFAVGQTLKSLPSTSQFPVGAKIRDKSTGKILVNDGSQWKEA